jgi:hypothetical protein
MDTGLDAADVVRARTAQSVFGMSAYTGLAASLPPFHSTRANSRLTANSSSSSRRRMSASVCLESRSPRALTSRPSNRPTTGSSKIYRGVLSLDAFIASGPDRSALYSASHDKTFDSAGPRPENSPCESPHGIDRTRRSLVRPIDQKIRWVLAPHHLPGETIFGAQLRHSSCTLPCSQAHVLMCEHLSASRSRCNPQCGLLNISRHRLLASVELICYFVLT